MALGDATQKASGLPSKDILTQFKALARSADLSTLREIAKVTSDLINSHVNPRAKTPSNEELDTMFKYVPNLFEAERVGATHTRSSQNQTSNEILGKIQDDINSLGLSGSEGVNSKKVRTKWLINPNVSRTHKDLKNADDINKFPGICYLRDYILI